MRMALPSSHTHARISLAETRCVTHTSHVLPLEMRNPFVLFVSSWHCSRQRWDLAAHASQGPEVFFCSDSKKVALWLARCSSTQRGMGWGEQRRERRPLRFAETGGWVTRTEREKEEAPEVFRGRGLDGRAEPQSCVLNHLRTPAYIGLSIETTLMAFAVQALRLGAF